MSNCCSDDSKKGNMNKPDTKKDIVPKSFIGKFLYNYGKKLEEKDRKKAAGGCC